MKHEARIVAVTDDPHIDAFLPVHIANEKYSITTVANAVEAVAYINEHSADAVVLDAFGDEQRGVDDVRSLRAHWSGEKLPVIVLTDTAECDRIIQLLQAGTNDFIRQPITAELVAQRVRALLPVRENVAKLLEAERQRVMSESLARASAITARAVSKIVDELEALMLASKPVGTRLAEGLNEVLDRTEQTVAAIDRIRQIALMQDVPYVARKHFLEEFSELKC